MDDLISRQAAIDAIKGLLGSMLETDTIGFYEIENVLFEVPSAQPEIIRCKDCKHWQSEEYIGNNNVHTLNIASLPCKNWLTGGDWYCGSAERKDI